MQRYFFYSADRPDFVNFSRNILFNVIEKNYSEESYENQEKYQEYLIKLDASKKSVEEDESLFSAFNSVKSIYQELKAFNAPLFFKKSTLIVCTISCLVYLTHIIMKGAWIGIAGIVCTLIFLIIQKIAVTRKIRTVNKHQISIPDGLINRKKLNSFIEYVREGIDLKSIRFQFQLTLFAIAAFFVFSAIVEIILGEISVLQLVLALVFAIGFSLLSFYNDLNKIRNLNTKLQEAIIEPAELT